MSSPAPQIIYRSDYQSPDWTITHTKMDFELDPSRTRVSTEIQLKRQRQAPLVLDGVDITLLSLHVDGKALAKSDYVVGADSLSIEGLPLTCALTIVTEIDPESNKALEGLYRSSGNYCTQCEAQGFRKITYYLDRPDVLATFDVSITADKISCPVLLSNGNFVSEEQHDDGRHTVHWHDPFPKPAYLFALVGGQLACIEDDFITASGRAVTLAIYVQEHNIDQCSFAMDALKRSMKWDEDVYGLEYDLDRFMIVAVDDFNMGAMENKGLNIFNSKYVLASEDTATDTDILGVEAVIAHEYFHNWTGNRVTCRDWFQLSLKEGLTVFRDQQFSADMQSKEVKRIEDVRLLRARQFPEDAGPMSHPIRPDSFIEINNFYTLTVYEKGAEVIRMIHTLLGEGNYYKGIKLYFERHDGHAVTCDDFISAMQDASGVDLTQFRLWYSQAGTPELVVSDSYDTDASEYRLSVVQNVPDTPGQTDKKAMHIPLRIGLLDANGKAINLKLGTEDGDGALLNITKAQDEFVFKEVSEKPTPSLLRGFSAPVRLSYEYSAEQLAFLIANDSDSFNRWEAAQRLYSLGLGRLLDGDEIDSVEPLLHAMDKLMSDPSLDAGYKAEMLSLPSIDTIASDAPVIDIAAIDRARTDMSVAMAAHLEPHLKSLITQHQVNMTIGERALRNRALHLLSELDESRWLEIAIRHFEHASNMTDSVAALAALCSSTKANKQHYLDSFYRRWESNKLVIDKWFSIQAMAKYDGVLDDVLALTKHMAFDSANPNRFRSLVGVFASANPAYFHAADGRAYTFVSEQIVSIDKTNPQVAARLVTPFLQWKRFVEPQKSGMQTALRSVSQSTNLSPDVYEIVSKALST